jgi:putative endonuclease
MIIFCIGYSSDLKMRLAQHNEGGNISTKGRKWILFYYEAYRSERAARRRERVLKGHGRTKQALFKRLLDDMD